MAAPRNVMAAARRAILERYPDMGGMRCSGQPAPDGERYIVTAQRSARTADGRSTQKVVHVTVDKDGKVLRISGSK
jgi:hypothetical protein